MNGTPRAQGCAGAVPLRIAQRLTQGCAGAACVSFTQSLDTCMDAKAAQYLASGHAVKHPCALILDFLSRKVLSGNAHPSVPHLDEAGNLYFYICQSQGLGGPAAGVGVIIGSSHR